MEALPRALIVAAMILGGALLVHGLYPADRFAMVPASNGAAYRLDRLTGSVLYCDGMLCRVLPFAVPIPGAVPKPGSGARQAPGAPGGGATGT
jgi:hypothetical protein